MAKTTVNIKISEELRKKLLTAAQDIKDENAKNMIFAILNEAKEVVVELDEKDIGPVIKGPAQHIAHQINN